MNDVVFLSLLWWLIKSGFHNKDLRFAVKSRGRTECEKYGIVIPEYTSPVLPYYNSLVALNKSAKVFQYGEVSLGTAILEGHIEVFEGKFPSGSVYGVVTKKGLDYIIGRVKDAYYATEEHKVIYALDNDDVYQILNSIILHNQTLIKALVSVRNMTIKKFVIIKKQMSKGTWGKKRR